jgi:hypothetical protein
MILGLSMVSSTSSLWNIQHHSISGSNNDPSLDVCILRSGLGQTIGAYALRHGEL